MDYCDITDRCIQFASQQLDNQIQNALSSPVHQESLQDLTQIDEDSHFIESEGILSSHLHHSSLPNSQDQGLSFGYSQSTISSSAESPQRLRTKSKNHNSDQCCSQHDSQSGFRASKKIGKGRPRSGPRKGYPTKNFLATFKGPHIQWLLKNLGAEQVARMGIIREINSKFGISMKDYEKLYTMSELRPLWSKMFQCKFLFRALMVSRCLPEVRKVYAPKIPVFEKAFEEQVFHKIN